MSTLTDQLKTSMRSWWAYEVLGAFLIIMSVLVIVYPVTSFVGLAFYFALTFFISGILRVITSLTNRDVMKNWMLYTIGGLIDIVLGVFLVSNLELSGLALALYIGFFVLFSSITAISKAFDLKGFGHKGWGWVLATGIVGLAISVMLIFNPILGAGTAVLWTALGLLAVGGFYIYLGIELHKIDRFINDKVTGLKA